MLVQPLGTGWETQAGPWTCWVRPLGPLPCKSPVGAVQAEVAGADPSPGTEDPALGGSIDTARDGQG